MGSRVFAALLVLLLCALANDASATFPTVVASTTSEESDNSTFTVLLPAGIQAGDLIIAFAAKDKNNTSTWPVPWVEIVDASNGIEGSLFVAYLIASGGETSVTVATTPNPDRSHHIAIRIPAAAWHGTTPPEVAAAVTGNSGAPNSGSLTPSWGAADTLWISTFAFVDLDSASVTGYPTNYTDNNLSHTPLGTAAGITIASRELNAVTDDPGQFTVSAANYWIASTLAVRPPSAPTTIVLTSGTTWQVPADWNNSNHTVHVIGGGGGGGGGGQGNFGPNGGGGGGGGGGGAYASATSSLSLTPLATINIQIGSAGSAGGSEGNGGTGGDTWFDSAATLMAKGGPGGDGASGTSPATTVSGGSGPSSIGDITRSGGGGGDGGSESGFSGGGGGGGGGAAGDAAVGGTGANGGDTASSSIVGDGGDGGQGNPATGGAGGIGPTDPPQNTDGNPGSAGTELANGDTGSGGGGSGGTGGRSGDAGHGAAGGNYGAAGGGGGGGDDGNELPGNGGVGAQGAIVITYTPSGSTASSGFNDPAADAARAGTPPSNPANAYGSDDTYSDLRDITQHDYLTYNFCIPDGATIEGVEVRTEWHTTKLTDTGFLTLQLRDSAGLLVGTSKTTPTIDGTTDVTHTLGGVADTWGASLTDTIVRDGNFGVSLLYTKTAGGGGNRAYVDNVDIKVTYTGGSGGCSAHWQFDEGTGQTAADSSPNGNDATLGSSAGSDTNDPSWSCVAGGYALDFDGVDNYANVGSSSTANSLTNDMTVAAWIKADDVTGLRRFAGHARTNSADGWAFGINGNTLRFTTYSVKDYDSVTATVTAGTWYHVAAVLDSSNDVTFYVDGTVKDTITHTSPGTASADDDFYIGSATSSGSATLSSLFDGQIEDLRIYDRTLTGGEISALATTAPTACPTPPVGHWNLDDGTGQTATDSSANATDGQLGSTTGVDVDDPTWSCVAGGNALSFAKVDSDYLDVPFDASLNLPDGGGSIAGWFKLNSSNIGQNEEFAIFWKHYHSNLANSHGIVLEGHQTGPSDPVFLQADIGDGTSSQTFKSSTTQLLGGVWYHAAVTWNASTLTLYLDGNVEINAAARTVAINLPNTVGASIGRGNSTGGSENYADGLIDDVRVYDRELSQAEVTSLAATAPVDCVSGLIGDWQIDDGSGQTAADSSGNSYDATLGSTGSLDANDPVWATCSVGGSALEFDGVDDYVEDPDGELYINGLTAFTASAWIKSDVIGTDRGFLHTVVPDGSDSFLGIRYDAAGSQSGFTNVIKVGLSVDGVNQLLESSANIQTTGWQHVALTWSSGNQFALYLAGSLGHARLQ